MRRSVALVTYSGEPTLTDDDRLLAHFLQTRRMTVVPAVWDDPAVTWSDFDCVVMRSCWDYHLRFDEFSTWLLHVEQIGVPMWNPPGVIRWNAHKQYLNELRSKGLLIPESVLIERRSGIRLQAVLRQRSWEDAVVKPAISASAVDTWRTTMDVAPRHESRFRRLQERADVLVQRYVPEISTEGEWSLIFIGGEFSHAVLKRPRAGDFRVQPHAGGTVQAVSAPQELRLAAANAVQHIPGRWLYVRVDGVSARHGFLLMELECIEPHLFFGHCLRARQRMTDALLAA